MPTTPRYRKLRYILAKADGKCTVCKKRAPCEGMVTCGYCQEQRDESREQLRFSRRLKDQCIECGEPTEGTWRCRKHMDQQNARERAKTAKRLGVAA